jgi:hypothetical protein
MGLAVNGFQPVEIIGVRTLDALNARAERGTGVAEELVALRAAGQGIGLGFPASSALEQIGFGFLEFDWLRHYIISV